MSVINEEYGHVYLAPPRTGTTTTHSLYWVDGYGHETYEELEFDDENYLVWATIRNPYKRIESAYSAKKRTPDGIDKSFQEWVMSNVHRDIGTISFMNWVENEDGEIIVDDVVYLGNLENGLSRIAEKINLDESIEKGGEKQFCCRPNNKNPNSQTKVRHFNATKDYGLNWEKSMIKEVNQEYEKDFEVFDFEKIEPDSL